MCGQRDDVMALLDASNLLLHPTSFDAFPTALLEAMAANVPVVATAVGGIPEIVVDDERGVLIPGPPTVQEVKRGVSELLDDPTLRARLADAGRARFVERFDAQAVVPAVARAVRTGDSLKARHSTGLRSPCPPGIDHAQVPAEARQED